MTVIDGTQTGYSSRYGDRGRKKIGCVQTVDILTVKTYIVFYQCDR